MKEFVAENWLALLSLLISAIALSISWKKNIWDRGDSDDKELLDQLKLSLQQAFNSIAYEKGGDLLPIRDRLGWLMGARHIIRYQELKSRLKTALHITLCDELEEFWRHKFYLLLKKVSGADFFEFPDQETGYDTNISPQSAAVIYAFSQWKEDAVDPLASQSLEDIVRQHKLFHPRHRHFQEFVEKKFPNIARRIQDGS